MSNNSAFFALLSNFDLLLQISPNYPFIGINSLLKKKVAAVLTSGFTNASTFFFLFKKGMVEMSNILLKNLSEVCFSASLRS